jgi:hypothetical protein
MRLTRSWELGGYAGAARVESKFIQTSAVDPVIAILLGIKSTSQIVHRITTRPNVSARLSRAFHNGSIFTTYSMGVNPGNGLFLTSYTSSLMAGYGYTGLRRWSVSANGGIVWSNADATISGRYSTATGTVALARRLFRFTHFTLTAAVRQHDSRDFSGYRRLVYSISAGVSITPGELPVRLW